MTDPVRTSWLIDTGQTREDTRLTQLGATLPADPLKVQSGILPGSADGSARVAGFWLKDQTAMTATIEPGRAVVQGLANQGAYPVTLAEPVVLTFEDGDQQDRIDLVCIQLADASYNSPTTSAALTIIKGAASATPQPPAIPALALPLYNISVPAGASAATTSIPWDTAVDDLRTTTVATGGVLPVYNNAAVPGAYTGQLRDHNDVIERWQDGAWTPYPQGIGGIAPASTAAGTYVGQYRDNYAGRLQRWNGTVWAEPIPSFYYYGAAGGGSTTSTTYTSTLSGVADPIAINFVAPPTGAVMFHTGARIETQGSTNTYAYMAVQITQGTTTYRAALDDLAVQGSGAYFNSVATQFRIYGLTAGLTYTATLFHRSSAAGVTCWFNNRYLRIDPCH